MVPSRSRANPAATAGRMAAADYSGAAGVLVDDERRPRARPRLSPDGNADQRVLWRTASRATASIGESHRRASMRRPASMSGTSRSSTTASGTTTCPAAPILHDIIKDGKTSRSLTCADQAGPDLCVRPQDRRAGLADRGARRFRNRPSPARRRRPRSPSPPCPSLSCGSAIQTRTT